MSSKVKLSVATGGASALGPKIRFPEFQKANGWRTTNLNSLLFEAKHRNRSLELGPADVLSVSGEYGCVNQIEFMGRSYAGVTVKDYHVVEHGDIVYTKSPLKKNPYGIIKENKGKRGIVSTLYAVYRPFPECCPTYLDHFFSVDFHLNSYLQPIVRKGAKNDMKVNNADVLKGKICVPDLPEQQKIAECLDSVDALIAAQGRKVEALKAHKKGLMQQLFPRPQRIENGIEIPAETRPRLRFPEFDETGDWEEKSFSAVIDLISGLHLSPDEYSVSGEVPYFSGPSDFTGELSEARKWTALTKSAAKSGDTLITVKGSGVGEGWFSSLTAVALGRQLMAVRPKAGQNHRFVFQFLLTKKRRLEILGEGNLIPGLSRPDILDLKAFFPKPPEQKRIADCLTSLDDLITAEARKLETLNTHKKGLMQQLFPQVGEAGA
ncbi:restriction endonuclease subunit S [Brucella anthropi]|uniref:restriction endonuclease subunit S n=1 Tax=Brucella anthropi TaxID=529 RepID=UPI00124D6DF9|nr:restriction endonuclease subunit S [Brucella anthropi]KAB2766086.1 restriction endonuclease subunit S [Brucella anthropi]